MSPNSEPDPRPFLSRSAEPEETLRLLATLPPPAHLEDRVHQRIAAARLAEPSNPRSIWSLWQPARRLQFAAAALLAIAVAISTWNVYHHPPRPNADPVARQPVTVPQPGAPQTPASAFQTSGAERHPSTLKPIKVPPAPRRKKPSAAKPIARQQAAEAAPTP